MRLYNQQNRFYCGVDLHARNMYTHILDAAGKTVYERGGLTSQSGLALHRPGRESGDTGGGTNPNHPGAATEIGVTGTSSVD